MSFARGGVDVNNPPFVIPVQIDNRFNDFIHLFTGYAMNAIATGAAKNQARAMFRELMEQDENALGSLVQELASLTQYAVDSEDLGPNQVELAIRNLIPAVVDGYLAMAVDMYPQQFGQVLSQQQAGEVSQYINTLNQIRQQARNFYNGGNNRGWGNNGGNVNGNGGYGGNRAAAARGSNGGTWGRNNGGNRPNQNYNNSRPSRWDEETGGDGGNYQTADRDKWPGSRMNNQGSGSDAVFGGGGGGARTSNASGDSTHQRPAREFVTTTNRGRRMAQDVTPQDPRVSVVDGQRFFPPTPNADWPKVINEQRIWDWILFEDGAQMRPAYQSTWKPSFDPDRPATPMYDPQEQILFHYKTAEGAVHERLLNRENTMEYLDHELDPNLRRVAKAAALAREGKAAPAWEMVENLRPNPSSPLATTEPLSEDAKGLEVRTVNPEDFLKTTSLADAIKRASLKLKVEHPGILNQAFELYIERAVLTTVLNPDFDLLFQLANVETFQKLYDLMVESKADEELLAEVDARIVAGIGEALTCHMGLRGWGITNFRNDFGDLLAALKEDYGNDVIPYLQDNAIEIISRSLSHYSEKELATVRDTVGLEENVVALVWRERSSVTRLPITAEQVKFPVDNGMLVGQTAHPEMYKTLSAVFTRTEDVPHTYHGRYLATTDGVVYALYNGYLGAASILVYKANIDLK